MCPPLCCLFVGKPSASTGTKPGLLCFLSSFIKKIFYFLPFVIACFYILPFPPVTRSNCYWGAPPSSSHHAPRDHSQLLLRKRERKRGREKHQLAATLNAPHIQTKSGGPLLVSPVDTITQVPSSPNPARGILWLHPLCCAVLSSPFISPSFSPPLPSFSPLLIFEHLLLLASLLACVANFFPPSHTPPPSPTNPSAVPPLDLFFSFSHSRLDRAEPIWPVYTGHCYMGRTVSLGKCSAVGL